MARGIHEGVLERLRDEGVAGVRLANECGGRTRGLFIAVEGIDGAGISTASEAMAKALRALARRAGQDAVYTKEPTFGPLGFHIWQAIRGGAFEALRIPQLMALLFAADRVWHLTAEQLNRCRGLIECILGPVIVVSDRYKYSSLAYQTVDSMVGGSRFKAPPRRWVEEVNAYAPPPHILVYIDVDVEVALERIARERWALELYETREFLERVRRNFREIVGRLKEEPEGRGMWSDLSGELECAYPGWRYPIVVEEDSTRKEPEELVLDALKAVLREASRKGLIEVLEA